MLHLSSTNADYRDQGIAHSTIKAIGRKELRQSYLICDLHRRPRCSLRLLRPRPGAFVAVHVNFSGQCMRCRDLGSRQDKYSGYIPQDEFVQSKLSSTHHVGTSCSRNGKFNLFAIGKRILRASRPSLAQCKTIGVSFNLDPWLRRYSISIRRLNTVAKYR